MDLAIICINVKFHRICPGPVKIAVAALAAGLIPTAFLGMGYTWFVVANYMLGFPLASLIVIGKNRKAILFSMTGAGISILIGGAALALENTFGISTYIELYILISLPVSMGILELIREMSRRKQYIFEYSLSYEDRCVKGKAFYDSGNFLRDPVTGEMVHIVDGIIIKELGVAGPCREIPYKALGNCEGKVWVYEGAKLWVKGRRGIYRSDKCLLGKAQEGLLTGKNYNLVLNEGVGNEII